MLIHKMNSIIAKVIFSFDNGNFHLFLYNKINDWYCFMKFLNKSMYNNWIKPNHIILFIFLVIYSEEVIVLILVCIIIRDTVIERSVFVFNVIIEFNKQIRNIYCIVKNRNAVFHKIQCFKIWDEKQITGI